MINPTELRIGNKIYLELGLPGLNIHTIVGQDIADICNGRITLQGISPIPLTPDILEKCGFEKKHAYQWHGNGADYQPETSGTIYQDFVKPYKDDNDIIYRFAEWFYTDSKGEKHSEHTVQFMITEWYKKTHEGAWHGRELKYLHELQNTIFALTGEELEVKL